MRLSPVFEKKNPDRGSNKFRRRLIKSIYVNKQATLLAASAHTTEISRLKKNLERAEGELDHVKEQLKENEGMH